MKINNNVICALLSAILLSVVLSGCANSGERQSGGLPVFSSYQDIPGVTYDEINAIEALREQREYFIYGMTPSTEAFLNRYGDMKGYAALLCEWLTELFGVQFILKNFSRNELFEGLQNGEVDFTGELTAGDERRQTYLMTDVIARRSLKYLRLAGSAPIAEIARTRPPRYALLEGTAAVRDVLYYAEEEFEPVYIPDLSAAYELLKSGEADALIAENTSEAFFDVYGDVVATNFLPMIYTPVSLSTQNPELAPIISVAQKILENNGIYYLNELYKQGYQEYKRHKLFTRLDEEEYAYINSSSAIPFSAEFENYPVSFYNTYEKEWQGIAFDVLREVEAITGLEFVIANDQRTGWPELLRMLEDGDVVMITELLRTKEREGRFLWPNSSFLKDYAALISKIDHRDIDINEVSYMKVGLLKDSGQTELFWRWFPEHNDAVEYDNMEELIEALMRGEVNMMMSSAGSLLWLTNYLERPGYKANLVLESGFESTFGFHKDAAVLCSIFDKALELVDTETISGQWLRKHYDYSIKVAQAQVPWIIGAAVALVLIFIYMTASYIEKAKINKTIAKQSALLAAIYDSLPAMVFSKDLNGIYTSCNRKFEELVDFGKTGIIGRTFAEVISYDGGSMQDILGADQRVIDENITITTEGCYISPDKSRTPMEVIKTPLMLDGKVAGLLGIALDITERKKAAEAMLKTHEYTKLMLDSFPLCSQLWSIDFETIDCNEAGVRLYGFADKQEYVKRFLNECSPEYQPDGQRSDEKALALVKMAFAEGYCVFDWMHRIPDTDERVPCEVTLIRVEYNDEVIVAGYTRDLREIKAAAEKAREAEERMQIMLDTMPFACRLINRDHEVIDCNREAINLFGVTGKEEYLEKESDSFSPEFQPCGRRSRELRDESLNRAFDEGYLCMEWMFQKLDDGKPLPCEITLVRVRHRGEYIIASYIRDLREQKAVIEEMRRAEIAEESSRAKSKFLATMSHEIRTPMNAVLGITEIFLQDETLDSKYEEAFSKIYSSSNMLLGIINDLLDMSKIEAGKLELVLARYETASLINDAVNLILARFGGLHLKFEMEAAENTPAAMIGDELRIKQILNNLLSNAFKYTKEGSVKMSVSAEPGDGEKGSFVTLVFRVSDTGVGMTEEQVSQLFDEYTRFNTEANRVTEGVGLGMHITRSLVHLMGGEIYAESEIGRGTTITVRLPQEDARAGAFGREVAENLRMFDKNKVAYARNTQLIREPMPYGRVLIVDDSDLNLYVARGLLAPYKLVTDTALSGFEAIDLIKRGHEYDIVFMDHMMPEMDGVQTVENIRGLGYSRPIAALTADAVSGRAEMFLKNGFDDFLSKPIDIRQLDAVLKKFIRDRHPREIVEAARAAHKQRTEAENVESEKASAFLDNVKKIAAINTEFGLSHFSGVEDMYYETLALFYKKLPRECDAMSNFINAQDMNGFSIAVHSMKSQLATIGAMHLSKTAKMLETASKNNVVDYCVTSFPAFNEDLLILHGQLSAVFADDEKSSAEKAPKEPGDPAYLREHIEKAMKAADDFDEDAAVQTLNLLQAYDYGEEVGSLLNDAITALDDFDFDAVGEILGKIYNLPAES